MGWGKYCTYSGIYQQQRGISTAAVPPATRNPHVPCSRSPAFPRWARSRRSLPKSAPTRRTASLRGPSALGTASRRNCYQKEGVGWGGNQDVHEPRLGLYDRGSGTKDDGARCVWTRIGFEYSYYGQDHRPLFHRAGGASQTKCIVGTLTRKGYATSYHVLVSLVWLAPPATWMKHLFPSKYLVDINSPYNVAINVPL